MPIRDRVLKSLHQLPGRTVRGESLFKRDADIYCVLDGCRVDTLRYFYANAESYWSRASTSKEWLDETFDGHDDVAYITGNPFGDRVSDDVGFYYQEPVSNVEGVETVPPERIADMAAWAHQNRADLGVDTVVAHFMQPHVPFRSRPEWFEAFGGGDEWGSARWQDLRDDINPDEWRTAYRRNLAWVLQDGVKHLQRRVDATIGITADHGNAAGEWGLFGHPGGVAVPAVRKVPWVTVDGEAVEAVGEVAQSAAVDRRRQLEALGYIEEV